MRSPAAYGERSTPSIDSAYLRMSRTRTRPDQDSNAGFAGGGFCRAVRSSRDRTFKQLAVSHTDSVHNRTPREVLEFRLCGSAQFEPPRTALNSAVLIRTDRATRACYRTDGGQIVYGFPDAVVHARCPEDVAGALRLAQRDRIPVTCRGGGLTTEEESVSGAGILLDVKGMNKLIECDGATAWVEAGMTWFEVASALRPLGLDYTSAPLNLLSTVGGTLGVGGIDVNSPRHGCAADAAVELEVVTPTGEIVRVKEGDEYMERVLLGYGQFGVITKARIKVRRPPMTVRHFLYRDIGVALADMMRLVERDAVEAWRVPDVA